MKIIDFNFADGAIHDALISEVSVSKKIELNYVWSIIPIVTGTDGTPTYTVEVSNDNVNFIPYDVAKTDVLIGNETNDGTLPFLYVRINYKKLANVVAGTVKFPLSVKR